LVELINPDRTRTEYASFYAGVMALIGAPDGTWLNNNDEAVDMEPVMLQKVRGDIEIRGIKGAPADLNLALFAGVEGFEKIFDERGITYSKEFVYKAMQESIKGLIDVSMSAALKVRD
jgi:hypothetical protein